MSDPGDEAVQFVELRRVRRQFGVSVDYNDEQLVQFVGASRSRLETRPGARPAGDVFLHLYTPDGAAYVLPVGWWLVCARGRLEVKSRPPGLEEEP